MSLNVSKTHIGEWLSLLRENANIGFLILDGEGKILSADAKMLSIWEVLVSEDSNNESVEGRYINDVIRAVNSFSEVLLEVRKTGHICVNEYPFITKKGSSKWAMVEGWILQENDEDILTGWCWVDITSVCERTNSDYLKMFGDALSFIFKDIPLMFFFWEITEDNRTKILGVNKEGENVLGYSSSEVIGKDFLEFAIPEAWKPAVKKYVENMHLNPTPYLGEHPLFTRDGQEVSIRWLDVPIKLTMFNRIWVVSIGEDIRERVKMERELRESEERYRRIVEAIMDYFYHVKVENGKVVETRHSPGCEAVTGYTPEEFYANPYLWYSMVYDEDKEIVLNYANAITRGEFQGPIVHRIIRKDGQIRWIRNTSVLVFDREGNFVGYDSLIRDITEEVIAQDALKKSELFYRGIIENLAEGYFEMDLEGNIKFANPSFIKILGKSRLQSLLNRKFIEFVELDEQPKLVNLFNEIKEKKKGIRSCEWKLKLDKKDEERVVECSFFPLNSHRGKVKGISGILRDITERKRQEEHLRQIQKWESLGAIVGGIAHDFNNLLMVMQGHLDLEEAEFPFEVGDMPYGVLLHHAEIENAIYKAKELCKQMMIYAGKGFAVHKKIHNINSIIESMLPVLETTVKRKVKLNVNLCKDETKVLCDEVLIRQVVLSLVTNSVEAIGNKEGLIDISTRVIEYNKEMFSSFILDGKDLPEGKYVEVVVEDTGCGIEAKDINKIFEPFYSSKFLGRGLGLSSVLGIVRSHQGGMKVESKVGVGTKMYVVFPWISSDTPVETDLDEIEFEETDRYRKEVVLIFDKDTTISELTRRILDMKGFDALSVKNKIKAMEVMSSSEYEVKLLILNVSSQENEWKELLEEIKQKGIRIPIILSGGWSMDDIIEEYRDIAVGILRKPYLPNEIINIVKENWK